MQFGQDELNNWMVQTIHFANVCTGTDEFDQTQVHDLAKGIAADLPKNPSLKEAVTAVLLKAKALCGPEQEGQNEEIEATYQLTVAKWCHKTVVAVNTVMGKPTHHEYNELVADSKIVRGIQGNRTAPCRHDLDLIVRKTIGWGLAELGQPVN
jgi:hypothetical protein